MRNIPGKIIKNIILEYSLLLDGVVLIGDLPAGWFETENDFDQYGYAEIDMSGQPEGFYMIKLDIGELNYYRKVIVR